MRSTQVQAEYGINTEVLTQLERLEFSMRQLMQHLSPSERLTYLNGLVIRMSPAQRTASAADKIEFVLQQRSGSSLTNDQREQIRKLAELTSRLYDTTSGGLI